MGNGPLSAVLVANRGEVAVRVLRACRERGLRAIAVHSEADAGALHVRRADESWLLGPAPAAKSYLDADRVIEVAKEAGADAVHPGYGFLAERADFAAAVAGAGMVFVGPSPAALRAMGDKRAARAVAAAVGVPVLPGTADGAADAAAARAFGEAHGYPIAVKAAHGGGGRGLEVVDGPDGIDAAVASAARESQAAFGAADCYLERYLPRPRHVEVQVLGDAYGNVVSLGDRDCTLQRRHQKLLEEAPAPGLPAALRAELADAAVRIGREVGYTSAGTCEFLVDQAGEAFYFLEFNARLQVEHPVTELVTGIDLVHAQLAVAAGEPLPDAHAAVAPRGHAIQARINAEDPAAGFAPAPGTVTRLDAPLGPWVRVDTGLASGDEVPPDYDSLIAKLIVWGSDREDARQRLRCALEAFSVRGVATTIPFHLGALAHPDFVAVRHATTSVDEEWDVPGLVAEHERPAEEAVVGGARGGAAAGTGSRGTGRSADEVAGGGAPEPGPAMGPARVVSVDLGGRLAEVAVYGAVPAATSAGRDAPARRASERLAARAEGHGDVTAPMQGVVVECAVAAGDEVAAGDTVAVVEAMKMQNRLTASADGTVTAVHCAPGDAVEQGALLVAIEARG